jgi:C_GCAxxG_C_C family probable redox protein
LSFKDYLGEQGALLPKIATGFGGGIGRRGSLCGALTASVMVLGMKFGRVEPDDQDRKEKVYELGYRFWDRFEKELGSCYCYDLIECHLDDAEDRQRWSAAGGMEKCGAIVERTSGLLFDFLEEIEESVRRDCKLKRIDL